MRAQSTSSPDSVFSVAEDVTCSHILYTLIIFLQLAYSTHLSFFISWLFLIHKICGFILLALRESFHFSYSLLLDVLFLLWDFYFELTIKFIFRLHNTFRDSQFNLNTWYGEFLIFLFDIYNQVLVMNSVLKITISIHFYRIYTFYRIFKKVIFKHLFKHLASLQKIIKFGSNLAQVKVWPRLQPNLGLDTFPNLVEEVAPNLVLQLSKDQSRDVSRQI